MNGGFTFSLSTQSASQAENTDLENITDLMDSYLRISVPSNPALPGRQIVPTYLGKLDKQWRGGWSWQWPMVIAGPPDGGKTILTYQILASNLLSSPNSWRSLYCDFKGDYHPEHIQQILKNRRKRKLRGYLGRLDKTSVLCINSVLATIYMMAQRDNLSLLVLDGWNHRMFSDQNTTWWNGLAKMALKKKMALLITVRGELEPLLASHPFESIPYFVYITKKKHRFHRVRVWQNSPRTKIYDQVVYLNGYFREKLPSSSYPKRD